MSRYDSVAYGRDVVLQGSAGAVAPASMLASGVRQVAGGYDTPVCQSTKKDGMPCKASPVGDGNYCIGHSRQHES